MKGSIIKCDNMLDHFTSLNIFLLAALAEDRISFYDKHIFYDIVFATLLVSISTFFGHRYLCSLELMAAIKIFFIYEPRQ